VRCAAVPAKKMFKEVQRVVERARINGSAK
jgi:hypothetical protein